MKKIILLDDNKELLALMVSILDSFGIKEIKTLQSYAEVEALDPHYYNYDLAFLDVNLGLNQPSGIDAFDWLLSKKFQGKIVFLTGHARSYPLIQKALKHPNVLLLEKPADIDVIESLIIN